MKAKVLAGAVKGGLRAFCIWVQLGCDRCPGVKSREKSVWVKKVRRYEANSS